MLAKRIGANIKAARVAKKWSLEKLAAAIDPPTSYQQVSRLETADRPITIEWVEKIANALGIDPVDILAPGGQQAQQGFTLSEQVADEFAQSLLDVALARGAEDDTGTVQVLALMLRELTATFSEHPQAAADLERARPLLTLASKRFAPAVN